MQYTVKMPVQKLMCPKIYVRGMDRGILPYCCAPNPVPVSVEGGKNTNAYKSFKNRLGKEGNSNRNTVATDSFGGSF
jgi:hypothetical protein